jgi:cellulose synthase/poly-beta-1,6-N-acetylglucosamine synthase-like glycosyltransferase
VFLALRETKRPSARISTYAVGFGFLLARFFYLPFLLILIPIDNVPLMPMAIYEITILVLVLFYIFLLLMPLAFALRWVFKYKLWRSYSKKNLDKAQERVEKRAVMGKVANMIVNMPIYNEDPEALIMAVESVLHSCYPKNRIFIYLSFDSDEEDELVRSLFKYLTGYESRPGGWKKCTRLIFKEVTFIINQFPHGGKRNAQALSFIQMAKDFAGRERDTFVLYLDSDIVLHKDAMLEFLRAMEANKGLVGMTGFISAISSQKVNFLQYFQDCEYVFGQIIARSLEAGTPFLH